MSTVGRAAFRAVHAKVGGRFPDGAKNGGSTRAIYEEALRATDPALSVREAGKNANIIVSQERGQTVWFFPDFLVWSGDKVLCVDTKGSHLVEADARRKLLAIEPHKDVTTTIEVKFVTEGSWKADGTPEGKDGYSVLALGSDRNLKSVHFDDLEDLVKSFLPNE